MRKSNDHLLVKISQALPEKVSVTRTEELLSSNLGFIKHLVFADIGELIQDCLLTIGSSNDGPRSLSIPELDLARPLPEVQLVMTLVL